MCFGLEGMAASVESADCGTGMYIMGEASVITALHDEYTTSHHLYREGAKQIHPLHLINVAARLGYIHVAAYGYCTKHW